MSDRRRKRPSLLLLLLCGLAGGALYLQTEGRLYVPQVPPQPVIEKLPFTPEPLTISVAFPPSGFFDEIAERPLFAETRSPPPPRAAPAPEAAPPPPPPERDLFALLGVAISDSSRIAIMRVKKTGEVSQVGVGDLLAGWSVREIRPRSVLFVNGVHENVVELQEVSAGTHQQAPQPASAGTGRLPRRPVPGQVNGAPPPPPAPAAAVPSRASAAR